MNDRPQLNELGFYVLAGAPKSPAELLDEVLDRWPEWDVDWDNAKQAHTAHVRGWEKLPVTTG